MSLGRPAARASEARRHYRLFEPRLSRYPVARHGQRSSRLTRVGCNVRRAPADRAELAPDRAAAAVRSLFEPVDGRLIHGAAFAGAASRSSHGGALWRCAHPCPPPYPPQRWRTRRDISFTAVSACRQEAKLHQPEAAAELHRGSYRWRYLAHLRKLGTARLRDTDDRCQARRSIRRPRLESRDLGFDEARSQEHRHVPELFSFNDSNRELHVLQPVQERKRHRVFLSVAEVVSHASQESESPLFASAPWRQIKCVGWCATVQTPWHWSQNHGNFGSCSLPWSCLRVRLRCRRLPHATVFWLRFLPR